MQNNEKDIPISEPVPTESQKKILDTLSSGTVVLTVNSISSPVSEKEKKRILRSGFSYKGLGIL